MLCEEKGLQLCNDTGSGTNQTEPPTCKNQGCNYNFYPVWTGIECLSPSHSPPPLPPLSPSPPSLPPAPPLSPLASLTARWCQARDEIQASGTSDNGSDSCAWVLSEMEPPGWQYGELTDEVTGSRVSGSSYSLHNNGNCDEIDNVATGSQWRVWRVVGATMLTTTFSCPAMTDSTDCCSFGQLKAPPTRRRALHGWSPEDAVLPLTPHKLEHLLESAQKIVVPEPVAVVLANWTAAAHGCATGPAVETTDCSLLGLNDCEDHAVHVVPGHAIVPCNAINGTCLRANHALCWPSDR